MQRKQFLDFKMFKILCIVLLVGGAYSKNIDAVPTSGTQETDQRLHEILTELFEPQTDKDQDKKETEELKECALVDDQARECVPYYLCKAEFEKQVGSCPSYIDTCCLASDQITKEEAEKLFPKSH